MRASFQGSSYAVVFTEDAKLQMTLRGLSESDVLGVIETGEVKAKATKNKFGVFRELRSRKDNLVSVSISVEDPHLIVITAMVSWRPR